MELTQGLTRQEYLLIGLEEIYREPLFFNLRLAMSKSSERQKLYEILTVVSKFSTDSAAFLIKIREALDRPTQEDFWFWLCRALGEIDENPHLLEQFNRVFKKETSADFNSALFQVINLILLNHQDLFFAVKAAIRQYDGNYCIEALKIFETYDAKAFHMLQRIRKSLIQPDTLDGTLHLLSGLEKFPQWEWTHQLKRVLTKYPDQFRFDSLSRSQIQSKRWALNNIFEIFGADLGYVHILCGWYGLMGALMFQSGLFKDLKVRSYDVDPTCEPIAEDINRKWLIDEWRFRSFTSDVFALDYGSPDTPGILCPLPRSEGGTFFREPLSLLINTSCEHLTQFDRWYSMIPKGTRLVLQTNNGFDNPEHVNCVSNIDRFKEMAPMSEFLFEGSLDCELFTRFMLIGYK